MSKKITGIVTSISTIGLLATGVYFGSQNDSPDYGSHTITLKQKSTVISVFEGQDVSFRCTGKSDAPITYQWQKNKEDIEGAIDTIYIIKNTVVKDHDSNTYACKISNDSVSIVGYEALLRVIPIISNGKNNKYSFASFKRRSLKDVPLSELNNSKIIGACFYQDKPFTEFLPKDAQGIELINCNLDNCVIPNSCTVIGGTNKQFVEQNDGEYWIVDKDLKPVEPRDKENFIKCGLSIKPEDIPVKKVAESVTLAYDPDRIKQQKIDAVVNNPDTLKAVMERAGKL